jgi:hypothetical protein
MQVLVSLLTLQSRIGRMRESHLAQMVLSIDCIVQSYILFLGCRMKWVPGPAHAPEPGFTSLVSLYIARHRYLLNKSVDSASVIGINVFINISNFAPDLVSFNHRLYPTSLLKTHSNSHTIAMHHQNRRAPFTQDL